MPKKNLPIMIAVFFTLTFSSCTCIYFNTFYNIRKNFNGAESTRQKDGRDTARGGEVKQYTDAIAKASKVLERHPTSSWVDDALYIIGASYFYLGEYDKAARKFKELAANYPQSEYLSQTRVLLAKAKLQLGEEAEAVVLFEEIFEQETDKKKKADAARSLGEYYFEGKDYASATIYFSSLIDSLGDDMDKLRARLFVADGYYERYTFSKALENYRKTLDYKPDTLQYYRIMYRMAECDYFLNNYIGGLEKLEELAENELYYDSLASIRLKMAEGYEWEGDYETAISIYEKIIVENPGKDAAAVSYYNLGLIYQYDFEELNKARAYYEKAREERRSSTVSEDATRRASKLALLEEYVKSGETEAGADTSDTIEPDALDKMTENQYMLGELFYIDLGKPDSALHAYQVLLDRYPRSRYAPRALMSMAYIQRNELNDTAAADSLLRDILIKYPRYDEAEQVISILGLKGTAVDTGYASIVFGRAEKYLERFMALDSSEYYVNLALDSILAADSLRRLDSTEVSDSLPVAAFPGSPDSLQTEDLTLLIDTLPSPVDSAAIMDSLLRADSKRVADSLRVARIQQRTDSIRVSDSIMYANARRVADSIQAAYRRRVIDSALAVDSIRAADSAKAEELKLAADSSGRAATVPTTDSTPVTDTTPADSPQTASLQIPDTVTPPAPQTAPPIDSLPAADLAKILDTLGRVDSVPDPGFVPSGDSMTTPQIAEGVDSTVIPGGVADGDSTFIIDSLAQTGTAAKQDSAQSAQNRPRRLDPREGETPAPAKSKAASDSLAAATAIAVADSLALMEEGPKIDYWRVAFDSARAIYKPELYSLLDSAQLLYYRVVDSFPFSDYSIQARYVLLWMYDRYLAPGDSSMISLYRAYVDSFPGTPYAQYIFEEYGIRSAGVHGKKRPVAGEDDQQEEEADTTALDEPMTEEEARTDSLLRAAPDSKFITDEDGNILEPAEKYKLREDLPFQYPLEALAFNIEDKLYFQIRIDFSGEVAEVKLMNETASSELNERIIETVKFTRFDAGKIPPQMYDGWFYYTYKVQIPADMKQ